MRKLVYSMMVSLDGFIETPPQHNPNPLDWVIIDEEIHEFANQEARDSGVFLYGRRLYENMAAFWPTADTLPDQPGFVVDFARIWKPKPKVVFSTTLEKVDWNSRLVSGNVAEEVVKLKQEAGGHLSVGGATLAASLIELGLVDEYRLLVNPVILGGGKRLFADAGNMASLELLDSRVAGDGIVMLTYKAA